MLTVADRGEGGGKICQNLADVICERSLTMADVKLPWQNACLPWHNVCLPWQ